jgi:hypothetical protein
VRSAGDSLGAARGTLFVLQHDGGRHWLAYEEDGTARRESCSSVAMAVFEKCALINNTRLRRPAGGAGAEGAEGAEGSAGAPEAREKIQALESRSA